MTSISKLIVGGFKSIHSRAEIPIAPLTFLLGPNSAGKSVILEAAKALKKRVTSRLDGHDHTKESYGAQVHSRPLNHRLQDSKSVSVHLGVKLENFSATHGDVIFDHGCSAAAMAFFGALHGSSVEVEVIDHLEWEDEEEGIHPGTESCVRVDGIDLLRFLPAEHAGKKGLSPTVFMDAAEQLESESVEWLRANGFELALAQRQLGAVRINLNHPLWTMTSIAQAQSEVQRFYLSEEFTSDKERQIFVGLLQRLRANIATPALDFLNETISIEEDWLCIGTHVEDLFQARGWGVNQLLPGVFAGEAWQTTGIERLADKKFLDVVEAVNVVLTFAKDFCKPILLEVQSELDVVTVSGDRGVLKTADVTFSFPPNANHGKNFYRSNNSISIYAERLAHRCVIFPKDSAALSAIRADEDFVNYALKQSLFGVRQYQVRPIVWRITTTTLRGQDSADNDRCMEVDDADPASTLKVQLYLEDQNGRHLDFEAVGSGISYVLPILASLQVAKASWIAQPELHLHPAAQCEMGDVFVRAFNHGHFSVVETHSEHLLLRVLKRIRQTTRGVQIDDDLKCAPEAVSVLYFDPQEDGSTQIRSMRVSRLGDFKDRWPHGFFEERGRELFDE